MPEEVGSTIDNLKNIETKKYGDLTIYSGDWCFLIYPLNLLISIYQLLE